MDELRSKRIDNNIKKYLQEQHSEHLYMVKERTREILKNVELTEQGADILIFKLRDVEET